MAAVVGAVKVSMDHDVWSLRTTLGSENYEKLKQYVLPGTIIYKKKVGGFLIFLVYFMWVF